MLYGMLQVAVAQCDTTHCFTVWALTVLPANFTLVTQQAWVPLTDGWGLPTGVRGRCRGTGSVRGRCRGTNSSGVGVGVGISKGQGQWQGWTQWTDLLEAAKAIVCQVQALNCFVGVQSAAHNLNFIPCQIQLRQACQLTEPCYETDLVVCKPKHLHHGNEEVSSGKCPC